MKLDDYSTNDDYDEMDDYDDQDEYADLDDYADYDDVDLDRSDPGAVEPDAIELSEKDLPLAAVEFEEEEDTDDADDEPAEEDSGAPFDDGDESVRDTGDEKDREAEPVALDPTAIGIVEATEPTLIDDLDATALTGGGDVVKPFSVGFEELAEENQAALDALADQLTPDARTEDDVRAVASEEADSTPLDFQVGEIAFEEDETAAPPPDERLYPGSEAVTEPDILLPAGPPADYDLAATQQQIPPVPPQPERPYIIPPAPLTPPPPPAPFAPPPPPRQQVPSAPTPVRQMPPAYQQPPPAAYGPPAQPVYPAPQPMPAYAPPAPHAYAAAPAAPQLQQRIAAYVQGGYRVRHHTPYEAALSSGKKLSVLGWIVALLTVIGTLWYLLILATSGFRADMAFLRLDANGYVFEDGPGAAHVRRQRSRSGRRWGVFGLIVFVMSLVLGLVLLVVAIVILNQDRYQAGLRAAYPDVIKEIEYLDQKLDTTEIATEDDKDLMTTAGIVFSILGGLAVIGIWAGATLFVIGYVHALAYHTRVPPLPGYR